MRRDYVTLEVRDTDQDGGERPSVVLTFEGPRETLADRLAGPDGEVLDRERVDVAFRFQTPVDAGEASGVFSLANRVTGEFVLEVNADAEAVLDLVGTARTGADRDDGDGCYRVLVRDEDEDVVAYEKRTLLVYDDDGNLLRGRSLIPSGVEL